MFCFNLQIGVASRFSLGGTLNRFCYHATSFPNFTVEQGCDVRNTGCHQKETLFCNRHQYDSRISVSFSLNKKGSIPSILYSGYTLYDWVDITIRERNICKIAQLDFEERYFSETIRIYQVMNKRYKVQRITNRKNSALLLQLVNTSFVTTANGQATMEVSVLMDLKYVFLTFKNIVHPTRIDSLRF